MAIAGKIFLFQEEIVTAKIACTIKLHHLGYNVKHHQAHQLILPIDGLFLFQAIGIQLQPNLYKNLVLPHLVEFLEKNSVPF